MQTSHSQAPIGGAHANGRSFWDLLVEQFKRSSIVGVVGTPAVSFLVLGDLNSGTLAVGAFLVAVHAILSAVLRRRTGEGRRELRDHLRTGDYIHEWKVVEKIDTPRGGRSEIFIVQSRDQTGVLKLMRGVNYDGVSLHREYTSLSRVSSAFVVRVLDYWTHDLDKVEYLVTEYAGKQTLQGLVEDGRLQLVAGQATLERERLICQLLYSLMLGISDLHGHKVIHGDISARNVVVHQQISKLVDLGASKRRDSETFTFKATQWTFAFRAPETAFSRRSDFKTDIFCWAAVGYSVATGEVAFPLMADQAYPDYKRTPVRLAELPPWLKQLFGAAFQPVPEERPTAPQMCEAIRAHFDELRIPVAALGSAKIRTQVGNVRPRWVRQSFIAGLGLALSFVGGLITFDRLSDMLDAPRDSGVVQETAALIVPTEVPLPTAIALPTATATPQPTPTNTPTPAPTATPGPSRLRAPASCTLSPLLVRTAPPNATTGTIRDDDEKCPYYVAALSGPGSRDRYEVDLEAGQRASYHVFQTEGNMFDTRCIEVRFIDPNGFALKDDEICGTTRNAAARGVVQASEPGIYVLLIELSENDLSGGYALGLWDVSSG